MRARMSCLAALGILAASACGSDTESNQLRSSTLTVLVPGADEWLFGPSQADRSQGRWDGVDRGAGNLLTSWA